MGAVWVITGPLGAGKSTVGRMLADCGARHLDADTLVHRLLAKHEEVHAGLRKLFGEGVFGPDGKPDRRLISRQVFADERLLRALEGLLHPAVFQELASEAADWRQTGRGLLFMEVVLWFQQLAPSFPVDGVLLVWAPREVLIARGMTRSGGERSEVIRRLDAQGVWDDWNALADRVLNTDCSVDTLRRRVQSLFRSLNAAQP